MNKIEELLLNFGYRKDEYDEIINSYPLKNYAEDTLYKKIEENFKFLLSLGYFKILSIY